MYPFTALANCSLFKEISPVDLEKQFQFIPYQLHKFNQGRLVALRGEEITALRFLIKGKLSAEIVSPQGKVLKVETLKAPSVIAGPLLFAEENFLPVQLTAEDTVEILAVPRKESLRLLSFHPSILQRFLGDCGDKVNFLSEKIRLYQFHSLRQKIAVYVMGLMNKQKSNRIRLPLKMEALSELLGVTRPSLSRSLGTLIDEGLLQREGKELLIPDLESIKAILEEE